MQPSGRDGVLAVRNGRDGVLAVRNGRDGVLAVRNGRDGVLAVRKRGSSRTMTLPTAFPPSAKRVIEDDDPPKGVPAVRNGRGGVPAVRKRGSSRTMTLPTASSPSRGMNVRRCRVRHMREREAPRADRGASRMLPDFRRQSSMASGSPWSGGSGWGRTMIPPCS